MLKQHGGTLEYSKSRKSHEFQNYQNAPASRNIEMTPIFQFKQEFNPRDLTL